MPPPRQLAESGVSTPPLPTGQVPKPPPADAWAVPATTETADAEASPSVVPAGMLSLRRRDNTHTLDQYLAQQKEKDDIVPKLETRKANDGADDIFKDAVALNKNEEEETYFVGKVRPSAEILPPVLA